MDNPLTMPALFFPALGAQFEQEQRTSSVLQSAPCHLS